MRYNCPSCSRVFYLDAKTVSPCPACGTMLQMQGDDAGDDGGADAAQQQPAGDNSWLQDAASADAAPPAMAPSASGGLPSAATWLSPDAMPPATQGGSPPAEETPFRSGLALEEADAPQPEGDTAPLAAATAQMAGAGASSGGMATNATMMAGQVRPTMGMRVAPRRGPSGTKLFFITAIAMIVAASIAIVIMLVISPVKPQDKDTADSDAAVATQQEQNLRNELNKKTEELIELQRTTAAERQELQTKITKMENDSAKLRGGFAHVLDASALTLQASTLLERRSDLTTALAKVSAAIKKDSAFGPAHRIRGKILAATGRTKEAIAAFEQADEVAHQSGKAGDANALVCAGEASLSAPNGEDKALELYKKAAALDPKDPTCMFASARALFVEGKYEEATKVAKDVRTLAPSDPLPALLLGEIAFEEVAIKQGKQREAGLKSAAASLADAVALDPNSPRAHLLYGRVLLEQAKLVTGFGLARFKSQSDAERMLSKAMRLSPTVPDVYLALAQLRLNNGALRDPAIALTRADEAVRLTDRRDASALATLAAAQAATGDPKNALTTIREALQIDPNNRQYTAAKRRYEADAQAIQR